MVRVKARGRLVGKHEPWGPGQRKRDQYPLALSHRQLLGAVAKPVAEAKFGQQRLDALCASRLPPIISFIEALVIARAPGCRLLGCITIPSVFSRKSPASRRDMPRTSFPPTRMLPLSGRRRPAIKWIRVVLPDPDGPYSATISPGSMVIETPSTARIGLSLPTR